MNDTNKKSIALQQPIVADYRMGIFMLLREHWGPKFEIYAGDADFFGSPSSTPAAWRHFKRVRNIYLFKNQFLWQYGSFMALLSAEVTILNANMRMLSNTVILVLRKLMGRRTILWGHATGKNQLAVIIRQFYLRSCNRFITYTESQAAFMRRRYPWLRVWVAANSCVSSTDCTPVNAELNELDTFLYVGRLIEAKKVRLLLEGFTLAKNNGQLPKTARLVFVGDGPEREFLENNVKESGLENVVEFTGHLSGVDQLRFYYRTSIFSISPGYVGLSATQSFSFGIPMLIAKDEFHSPEIEACRNGFNSLFFESDNAASLAGELSVCWQNREVWNERREEISKWTGEHYSYEVMRDAFINAVEH